MKTNPQFVQAVNDGSTSSQRTAIRPKGKDEFVQMVNETMQKKGIGWNEAWTLTKRTHADMYQRVYAVNENNVKLSADGNYLLPSWPVPSEVLLSLELPLNATRQMYAIAKLGEDLDAETPQNMAYALTTLIRYQQLRHGSDFPTAWDFILQQFGDLLPKEMPANLPWPVSESVLLKNNLPVNAKREQYALFVLAGQAKLSPALAAWTFRLVQAFGETNFDTTAEFFQKYFPEIWKPLSKVK